MSTAKDNNTVGVVTLSDSLAIIILNRTKKLNAINFELMDSICGIYELSLNLVKHHGGGIELEEYFRQSNFAKKIERKQKNQDYSTIITKSTETIAKKPFKHLILTIQILSLSKAFCAGGDVAALVRQLLQNSQNYAPGCALFQREYSFNYIYLRLKCSVVSYMDGITLGGGCGLSCHLTFRIVTPSLKVGMPEMKIGFFPDVGALFFFTQLDKTGYLGWYLCLTAEILDGYDAIYARIATHYIELREVFEDIVTLKLVQLAEKQNAVCKGVVDYDQFKYLVNETLNEYSSGEPKGYKFKYSFYELQQIKEMFENNNSMAEVISYLERSKTEFSKITLAKLKPLSQLSLATTFELFKMNSRPGVTCFQAIQNELTLAQNMIENGMFDMIEGVNAKLITKTNNPTWKFTSIKSIPEGYIEKYGFTKNTRFTKRYGTLNKYEKNKVLYDDSDDYPGPNFTFPSIEEVTALLRKNRSLEGVLRELKRDNRGLRMKKGLKDYCKWVIYNNEVLLQNKL